MSKFPILQLPNPLLRKVCKQVTFPLKDQTLENIRNLKTAFRDSFLQQKTKTLGLAAPQIGVLQRFFLMPKNINIRHISLQNLKSAVRSFNVYINPKILSQSEVKIMFPENCLSIGTDTYKVFRSQSITVEYFNTQGERIEEKLNGIRARVFLHQNDHLDGITMEQRGQIMSDLALQLYKRGIQVHSHSKDHPNNQTL